jgi:hypothetical protein
MMVEYGALSGKLGNWQKKAEVPREKAVPAPFCPPHIPYIP